MIVGQQKRGKDGIATARLAMRSPKNHPEVHLMILLTIERT